MHIMFSSLSHEFRTPLNSFANSLVLIDSTTNKINKKLDSLALESELKNDMGKLQDQVKKFTKMGMVSSKILELMVEDIMDFAKIEAGTFSLNPSVFLIEDLIKDLNFIFMHQCEQKGVEFSILCSEEVRNTSFNSDNGRIRQILMNLISNSTKFTSEGYIRLTIKLEDVNEVIGGTRRLKFTVSDSGIGISKSDQNKLFKVFGTVKSHRDTINMKGTGLGLTITQKIIKVLNCSNKKEDSLYSRTSSASNLIKLTSEEGKGTVVEFIVTELEEIDHISQNLMVDVIDNAIEDISRDGYNSEFSPLPKMSSEYANLVLVNDTNQ